MLNCISAPGGFWLRFTTASEMPAVSLPSFASRQPGALQRSAPSIRFCCKTTSLLGRISSRVVLVVLHGRMGRKKVKKFLASYDKMVSCGTVSAQST